MFLKKDLNLDNISIKHLPVTVPSYLPTISVNFPLPVFSSHYFYVYLPAVQSCYSHHWLSFLVVVSCATAVTTEHTSLSLHLLLLPSQGTCQAWDELTSSSESILEKAGFISIAEGATDAAYPCASDAPSEHSAQQQPSKSMVFSAVSGLDLVLSVSVTMLPAKCFIWTSSSANSLW